MPRGAVRRTVVFDEEDIMWWWHDGWGFGGWILMTVGMLAFWGFVAWMAVAAARALSPRESQGPEEILDARLASGEIDIEEYERRKDVLHRPGPPARAE